MNKYQKLDTLAYRVMGFAQSVRDLHELKIHIDKDRLIEALIRYANDYDKTKAEIHAKD